MLQKRRNIAPDSLTGAGRPLLVVHSRRRRHCAQCANKIGLPLLALRHVVLKVLALRVELPVSEFSAAVARLLLFQLKHPRIGAFREGRSRHVGAMRLLLLEVTSGVSRVPQLSLGILEAPLGRHVRMVCFLDDMADLRRELRTIVLVVVVRRGRADVTTFLGLVGTMPGG